MTTLREIPLEVRRRQTDVSNPAVSAWVAANAGSGKTHVLAQRVINLLLEGVEPEKILCITFTKAAAANMAKQVFDRLGAWIGLADAKLDEVIGTDPAAPADPRRRTRARRLFARALETPGGLKVQTIHAFCTQLLHRFPFEANVAARFAVLDETTQTHLLEQLTLAVLLDGAGNPGSALGGALEAAMTAAADQTFRDVVRGAIAQRDAIARWVGEAGDLDAAIVALSRSLGVEPNLTRPKVEDEIVNGPILPAPEWPAVAAICRASSAQDQKQCERLTLAGRVGGSERVEAYLKVFFDSKCLPRANLLTQPLVKLHPALARRLLDEQARVLTLHELRNAVICRDRSAALVTVAFEVLKRFGREKARRGLVDYDDLIDKTLELLRNVDATWVHYKLDLGINHLLIDEAQDTSSKQWEIVQRLIAEFTAGAGARGVKRTIFAVGDEKQSIYSFQNAAPREFAAIGRTFARAHADAELPFIFGRLEHSFRSGESVLAAVDIVFRPMFQSVTSDKDGFPAHIALPDAPPSMVEIWEPMKPDERKDMEGWQAPFDRVSETSPRVKLARRIARSVRKLIDNGEPVTTARRPTRYGDVLILVRQRGELFEAIIRALKQEHVDVAGADRLVLTEHIAVMDLMVLADALLLPEDDLALATVLRSPLFGFEETDLYDVAWDRGALSLRAALARKSGEKFAAAAARLDALALEARRETPFAFYAKILGAGDGRRRFLARLGAEANDALDEFLNLAFAYERRETPSLQGFVAWLREARAEVKRDMEIARDEVRVMTVHGAKGLEAPIVILADTMTPPAGPRAPQLLKLADGPMIWAGRKADDVAAVAAARRATLDEATHEYRRLLYVAMTRAADRLIVCGADGRQRRPAGCWYDLVREPLVPFLVEEDGEDGKVLRYRKQPSAPAKPQPPKIEKQKPPQPAPPPSWLRRQAPAETPRAAPLLPSAAFDEEIGNVAPRAGSAADRQRALLRGRIVHRLMQSLPDVPPKHREAAGERYLAGAAKALSATERSEILRQVLAILDDHSFAEIFAAGSRAEVPIVGRVTRGGAAPLRVAGQVDRLTVSNDAALIADYKTDSAAPRRLDEVAPAYVTQLALYRAVLAGIYPEKTVRAALVFTAGPHLMEVPALAMDAALAEVLRRGSRSVEAALTPIP
jgi:ATP-dependent helicase/nuclease subunit A